MHRFPEDILVNIAALVSFTPTLVEGEKWDWIMVTHVCRRWREVFLRSAFLWSRIDFANMKRAHVFLKPSVDAPIQVVFNAPPNRINYSHHSRGLPLYYSGMVRALKAHAARVSSLSLAVPSKVLGTLVSALLLSSLRSLTLRVPVPNASQPDPTPIPVLPFSSPPPRLEILALDNVIIPFKSPIYCDLVILSLEGQYRDDPSQDDAWAPSMQSFLLALESSPRLKSLTLRSAGPKLPHTTVDYPEPSLVVHLPKLATLILEMWPVNAAYILASFYLPREVYIQICCDIKYPYSAGPRGALPRELQELRQLASLSTMDRATFKA